MLETGFNPWVGKIPWRRKWQPTPVFLAWKIPWMEKPGRLQSMGSKKLEITEWLHILFRWYLTSLVAQRLKHLPPMRETWVWSLGQEDPLEKEMATHSSILAWRIPWTEEPGGLQSTGSQRVGHDWVTLLTYFVVRNLPINAGDVRDTDSIPGSGRSPGGGHGNIPPYSCLENPMDREAWWPAHQWGPKSWTWLKHLSVHLSVMMSHSF